MTIALGLLTSSGMVFATDSEESWGERAEIKTAASKILTGSCIPDDKQNPPCSFAVAGAGNSDLLQAVKLDLLDKTLFRPDWRLDIGADLIEKYLLGFYTSHVQPYWPHIEDFQLLIGINRNDRGALWGTTQAALRPCMYGYEAIGIGRPYALALLSRFHDSAMSLNSAVLLAIHVISCVKEFIGGCGKDTRVVALTGPNVKMLDATKVDEAERLFKRWLAIDSQLMDYIVSNKDNLKTIVGEAKVLRKELAQLDLLKVEQAIPLAPKRDH